MEFTTKELFEIRDALNVRIETLVTREAMAEAHEVAVLRDRVQDELDKSL